MLESFNTNWSQEISCKFKKLQPKYSPELTAAGYVVIRILGFIQHSILNEDCTKKTGDLQMESQDTPLLGWMVTNLGLAIERAELVNKKLADSWIYTVESLQTVLSENPNVFDEIEIPKPIQAVFKAKLSSFSSKKVEELVESEVMHLIGHLFPGEDYNDVFHSKKINGFVLSSATGPAKLVEWGIASPIHAEALWTRLTSWKQTGVQFKLLREAASTADSRKTTEKSSEVFVMSIFAYFWLNLYV